MLGSIDYSEEVFMMVSSKQPPTTVIGLSWSQLNEALLECDDVATLQRWLAEVTAKTKSVHRALRVHSRMNTVRRAKEVAETRRLVHANGKVRHT